PSVKAATDGAIPPATEALPGANPSAAWVAAITSFAGTAAEAGFGESAAEQSTADRVTPRRTSRCCNILRACANRPDTVPSFQPSCRAASALLLPSRQQSTNAPR